MDIPFASVVSSYRNWTLWGENSRRSRFRRRLLVGWGECEPENEDGPLASDRLHEERSWGSSPSRSMSSEVRADESVSAPGVSRKYA